MAEISLARSAQQSPELVECFRHEGEGCPRCDGSGFSLLKHCEGCGEPTGLPSEGGKALIGMKNARGSAVGVESVTGVLATAVWLLYGGKARPPLRRLLPSIFGEPFSK